MATTISSDSSSSPADSQTNSQTSPVSASPAATDAHRAQQQLERALQLAERGDMASALLACRQSISLQPAAPQGYSMLGLLLERSGDRAAAIAAYEKVMQIAPDSILERESLSRLRAAASNRALSNGRSAARSDLFVFDDHELFADERRGSASSPASGATAPVSKETAALREAEARLDARQIEIERAAGNYAPAPVTGNESRKSSAAAGAAPATATPAAATPVTVASAAAPSAKPFVGAAPRAGGSAVSSPLATPTPAMPARAPASPARPIAGAPDARMSNAAAPTVLNFDEPARSGALQKLLARPSYYFRGAPLAATALVSLLFLLWAHDHASSRGASVAWQNSAATSSVVEDAPLDEGAGSTPSATTTDDAKNSASATNGATDAGATSTTTPSASATSNAPTDGSGAVVTARPVAPSVPSTTNTPTTSTPSLPAPARSGGTSGGSASGRGASSGRNASGSGSASRDSGGFDGLSGPPLPTPEFGSPSQPDDTVRIVPGSEGASGSGGSASGGAPFRPGAGGGYVRVTPGGGRSAAPPRPESRGAREERAAAEARGAGRGAGIDRMTRAIESGGGDTAIRYQQRAQMYLNSGDNVRAINDFQTAIAAYNDMIARGDRVSAARSGIAASQRGIQIAQARLRR